MGLRCLAGKLQGSKRVVSGIWRLIWKGCVKGRAKNMVKRMVALFVMFSLVVSVCFGESSYVVVPAQQPFTSAESWLKDFSKKAEDARIQSAMYGVGLGLLYISLGSSLSGSSSGSSSSSIYYGLGAGMSIIGIKSYLYPTELENNYGKIRQMSASTVEERAAREAFAEKSLKQGAEEAQQGRMIVSGILVGVGLLSGSSIGLLYAGLGAVSYIIKSEIERGYEEYVVDKEDFIKSQPAIPQVDAQGTVEAR